MNDFSGKLAVITGSGTGMGRALARQLVERGCDVAMCDVIDENLEHTMALCREVSPQGVRVTAHHCDVGIEDDIVRFRDEVAAQHDRGYINLLFNNAGIAGSGSFVRSSREDWERTFNICWNGVYLMTRHFLPLLLASEEGHVVNTSSVNGFHATLGGMPHTAYSSAKFAVKGFTESLITDFRYNAPHLKASVVMPGYIGTGITANTRKILGSGVVDLTDDQIEMNRERWLASGLIDDPNVSTDELRSAFDRRMEHYDEGGMTAEDAATVILKGVAENQWRILVGEDAFALDEAVRTAPDRAYDADAWRT